MNKIEKATKALRLYGFSEAHIDTLLLGGVVSTLNEQEYDDYAISNLSDTNLTFIHSWSGRGDNDIWTESYVQYKL